MDGNGAAQGLAEKFKAGALAQLQHGFIEDARHHINVLPQVFQNFPGVFRGVLKGDQLELDLRAEGVDLRPKLHQHLGGGHGRGSNADHPHILLHGVFGPCHRIPAILDDVPGVLIKGMPCFGEGKPPVGADKQFYPKGILQEIYLLDDRRGGDEGFLRRLVEAAGIGHLEKGLQLGIVHRASPSFSG